MDLTELSKDLGAVSTQLAAWAAAELPNLLAALLILGGCRARLGVQLPTSSTRSPMPGLDIGAAVI
jgi:hypothetical protein